MNKRMLRTALTFLVGAGFMVGSAQAQSDYGEYTDILPVKGQSSLSFLKVGASPRAVGMGEAFVSMDAGIDAMYYNPGALGFVSGGEYSLTYTKWLVNSALYSGAAAYRFGSNTIGISVVSFVPEEVEETTIFQATGTGRMIRGGDTAIGLAFARQMTDKVSWGAQVRWVQEDLVLKTTSTFQFDMGISAYTGYRSLRIAAAARNVGSDIKVETQQFSPPINFNFGMAMEVYGEKGDPSYLSLAAETITATDFGQRWNFGGELWLGNMVALRGGYKLNYDIEDFSLGLGLKYPFGGRDIRVDVSYSDGGTYFDPPLRVALSGSF
ncbi:MAG: hypothetical protein ACI8V2_005421 [Candidatus Latescibacterota bacterium]|jgi:hypothetical protein